MRNLVLEAQDDIMRPDVQAAMQTLARYGLGVNVPHKHNSSGDFEPLNDRTVSFEQGLKVSFHDESEIGADDSIAVAWRWDEATGQVRITGKCRFGGSGCIEKSH
jgi:hypothetical protein